MQPSSCKIFILRLPMTLSIYFSDVDNESEKDDLICDICGAWTSYKDAYHCSICDNGNFDNCEECKEWGAICLNDTHEMINQ